MIFYFGSILFNSIQVAFRFNYVLRKHYPKLVTIVFQRYKHFEQHSNFQVKQVILYTYYLAIGHVSFSHNKGI